MPQRGHVESFPPCLASPACQVGRGLRQCDGKTDCVVLDVVGNSLRHGPVTEAHAPTWAATAPGGDSDSSSSDESPGRARREGRRGNDAPPQARAWVCSSRECSAVSPMIARACAACGAARPLSSIADAMPEHHGVHRATERAARRASEACADAQLASLLGGLSLGGDASVASGSRGGGGVAVKAAAALDHLAIPRKKKVPVEGVPAAPTRPLAPISLSTVNGGWPVAAQPKHGAVLRDVPLERPPHSSAGSRMGPTAPSAGAPFSAPPTRHPLVGGLPVPPRLPGGLPAPPTGGLPAPPTGGLPAPPTGGVPPRLAAATKSVSQSLPGEAVAGSRSTDSSCRAPSTERPMEAGTHSASSGSTGAATRCAPDAPRASFKSVPEPVARRHEGAATAEPAASAADTNLGLAATNMRISALPKPTLPAALVGK